MDNIEIACIQKVYVYMDLIDNQYHLGSLEYLVLHFMLDDGYFVT